MTATWTHKDLLGIRELTVEEINMLLDTAAAFKEVGERAVKKVPSLRGKDDGESVHRALNAHANEF